MAQEASGRIVVGVDGSAESAAALAWALDEARRRGATLEVVHAWSYPALAWADYGGAALPVIATEDIEQAAQKLARDSVASIKSKDEAVPVTTTVERGHPAETLLAAAKGADLLVVGSRGHGGFAGLLLGSVSNQVLHHATCPVVVVRAP